MTRTAKVLLLPVILAQGLFFLFIAHHRFVDGDEGFYLLASRLLLLHKKPYVDFAYVQAPLLPYVFAGWMKITTLSWASARTFSGLITTVLGTLVYAVVCQYTKRSLAGIVAVVLFASSALVFACFPTAHPFSLATLFLFAAYMVVTRRSQCRPWITGAAGILLALSVATRSYLLLIAPVFLWWIYRNANVRVRLRAILFFLGGLIAGLLPCLYLFVLSPSAFMFNNLGYHALRSDAGLVGAWLQKFAILLMLLLGGPQANGVQTSILLFISIAFLFSIPIGNHSPRLAFQTAVAVGIVSLLPTPVYPGYFSLCIPFLIVSAVCVMNDLLQALDSKRQQLVAICAATVLLAIYLGAAVGDLRKYLITGEEIATVGRVRDKGAWRMERIVEVSRAIDEIASPGEAIGSLWPGYVFQTKTVPLPGLENDFVLPVAEKMTGQERDRYHVLSLGEVENSLAAHVPRIVVIGNENRYMEAAVGNSIAESLRAHGYTRVRSIGDTSIYVCCSKS